MTTTRDQQHPQETKDKVTIDRVLQQGDTDYNKVEVARLCIRYRNFPGARQIQHQLEDILQQWGVTEEELFAQTREIHAKGTIYRYKNDGTEIEDWS
ncbi:DUF3288 family protein [Spirulina sp. CS-785/01]|uniref:DUF3288 family protein n=1 Tax=Spirulina sp. CS-785/01 TaxID=3021716 RepID=UPI0023313CF4|nr:DUF3288 family protein [Spirulina sp. CS-785/01]MDB9313021.1 DUF3288 family protein [Spirulina sp. CS-785/01]